MDVAGQSRMPTKIEKQWQNLKSRSRAELTLCQKADSTTGEGRNNYRLTPLAEAVLAVVGTTSPNLLGIEGGIDTDQCRSLTKPKTTSLRAGRWTRMRRPWSLVQQLLCYVGRGLLQWQGDRLRQQQLLKSDGHHWAGPGGTTWSTTNLEAQHTARRLGSRHTGCGQAVLQRHPGAATGEYAEVRGTKDYQPLTGSWTRMRRPFSLRQHCCRWKDDQHHQAYADRDPLVHNQFGGPAYRLQAADRQYYSGAVTG
ncbi:hypothetical protein HPB47_024513 [Ixodes persulcatus]|uniref:Uncharacterized protein n=1 Tax=Ixodes persulcatus TaxID=34615 RepID=A0AC60Q4D2_IXOPE|nr:hypothetical protein HPB47_024513 [Ixodes persulcatus]